MGSPGLEVATPSPATFEVPGLSPRAKWAVWSVVALLGVALLVWRLKPVQYPKDLVLAPAREGQVDSCRGKAKCVVVATAPWCPACKQGVPIIQALARRWATSREVGLRVVVTSDELANVKSMAESLGPEVTCWLDPRGELMKRLGGGGVPHWYVVDIRNRVVVNRSGVYLDEQAQADALGL